jgi:hypothetical protein
MDDYTAEADKLLHRLLQEGTHLERIMHGEQWDVDLALSVAKKVRRESTMLVRALARARDQLQP